MVTDASEQLTASIIMAEEYAEHEKKKVYIQGDFTS
jgi:hypothetical protein